MARSSATGNIVHAREKLPLGVAASRWIRSKERSPPRMTWPCRASPSASERDSGASPGDRHDAERDTGEKNGKARKAAAKFACGDPQREREA